MKFIHLADLHIGKRVNEYSMIEDQRYVLEQIIKIIKEEKPDAVLIAGDVYDKSVPSAEAVELLDCFLFALYQLKTETFIISGNHDSAERLAFGSRLIEKSGIHFSPVYNGTVYPVTVKDRLGEVNIYMLPFVKPSHVRAVFPDKEINSYNDALKTAVEAMKIDVTQRNILVTHQFVTGSARADSEDISVGGSDNVDAAVFSVFDYTALGHLHRPQNCGSQAVRYSGAPLKYSFSEANDIKSVTIGELPEKNKLSLKTIPLTPMRDLAELKGNYSELTEKSFYENTSYRSDYVHITLTDEDDVPDAAAKLRSIYKNLMKLDYDNIRTRSNGVINEPADVESKSPAELFGDFYRIQNGAELSEEESRFLRGIIERVWEEEA